MIFYRLLQIYVGGVQHYCAPIRIFVKKRKKFDYGKQCY